jgi:hypothetical protein
VKLHVHQPCLKALGTNTPFLSHVSTLRLKPSCPFLLAINNCKKHDSLWYGKSRHCAPSCILIIPASVPRACWVYDISVFMCNCCLPNQQHFCGIVWWIDRMHWCLGPLSNQILVGNVSWDDRSVADKNSVTPVMVWWQPKTQMWDSKQLHSSFMERLRMWKKDVAWLAWNIQELQVLQYFTSLWCQFVTKTPRKWFGCDSRHATWRSQLFFH